MKRLALVFLLLPVLLLDVGAALAVASANPTARLKQVLRPILKGHKAGEGHLDLHGCGVPISKIVQFLVFGSPFVHTFQFSVDCDVQGTVQVRPGEFPVDVDLKGLGELTHLKAMAELVVSAERNYEIVLKPHLSAGKLSVKGETEPLDFAAHYRVAFRDITHLAAPVNEGGKIDVSRFKGKSLHFLGDLWFD